MKKIVILIFLFFSICVYAYNSGEIIINITDKETGSFLDGAIIKLTNSSISYEEISEDGEVFFLGVRSGKYTLTAELEGYESKSKKVNFNFSKKDDFSGSISLKQIVDNTPYNFSVFIKDNITGEMLDGALVHLDNGVNTFETESDKGVASFSSVPSGKFKLTVKLYGYTTKTNEFNLDFRKKKYIKGTVRLVEKGPEETQISEESLIDIFKNDKQILSLIQEDEKLNTSNEDGVLSDEDLGLHRARLAALLLEKSLKENNSKYYQLAWSYAVSSVELAYNNPYPWFVYGLINLENRSSPEAQADAEESFRYCLDLDPSNEKAREYLADTLYNQNLLEETADVLEDLLYSSDNNPNSRLISLLNITYIRGEMLQRGENFLTKLSEKFPDSISVKLLLAVLYQQSDKRTKALTLLDNVIQNKKAKKEEKAYAHKLIYWVKE